MDRWCYQALLLLCLVSVLWNVVQTDDQNFKAHCCTYFDRLDSDGDKVLTVEPDFRSMAWAILTIDVSFDPVAELLKIRELAKQLFKFFPLVDVNIIQAALSGGVKFKEFMESMDKRRCTPELKKQIVDLVFFIHKTFNSDGADMNLTRREFEHVYKVFRIDPSKVDAGFNDMDLNHDNVITVSECNANAQLYFCEAPLDDVSNSWPGPEITCDQLVEGDGYKLP